MVTIPIIIKQVPPESVGGKILFCGSDGRFYNARGRELKPSLCAKHLNGGHRGGSKYPFMRQFGDRSCHHLVYETFVGPRTPGMEIDHVNGNMMDWSADNLEEVTTAENIRRAKYIRALREVFPLHAQTFRRADYHRFFAMPFEEFQAMLATFRHTDPQTRIEWEMSHHVEN